MKESKAGLDRVNTGRRRLLEGAGAGALAVALGTALPGVAGKAGAREIASVRWGIVGTGRIANAMVAMIQLADHAALAAVSSRKMETAREFAAKHAVGRAFDSWADMIAWDGVDAIYIATPTSVREEIAVAAANGGKHVLGEKPFANLPSLKRITAACRGNGVVFMDGTHFVHHPRTAQIRSRMAEDVGRPWSVASAFQFGLSDTGNIRLRPDLEPYGAIGDTGWYNMRAAVEYLSPDVELARVEAYLKRETVNHAVVRASGVLEFNDGSISTFDCGFESGAGVQDLRISGKKGVVKLDDFLRQRTDGPTATYELRQGWRGSEQIEVPVSKRGAALMFEDFAALIDNPELRGASIRASERTQGWLDAVWQSANANET
jgi:predicted dehydrogenase